MRFSILINCHNQPNYIDECILSSLNQNYENFEVIVVDSSDIKLNLEKFKSRKNFKYFHKKRVKNLIFVAFFPKPHKQWY